MMVMMMMIIIIITIMIMTIVSVEQRPGWGGHIFTVKIMRLTYHASCKQLLYE